MPTGRADTYPRLLADIGGTNARFALQTAEGLQRIEVLACAEHPSLEAALRHVLDLLGAPQVRHVAIAIATPVQGDAVRMTNHHWAFSIEATRQAMGWNTLLVINDFTALALALPHLPQAELRQIGGAAPRPGGTIGLLGAGTGLGVSGLIATDFPGTVHAMQALSGEGGHVSFAPFDEREMALWRYAHARHGHVSAERILSGPGLQLIHDWLGQGEGVVAAPLSPADIAQRGRDGVDARCAATIDMFCAVLGTVAANLALTLGAVGGVYVGGGIVPKLGDAFMRSPFRARFDDKGRFSAYLARIPVFVIHSPYPALLGVAQALEQTMQPTRTSP